MTFVRSHVKDARSSRAPPRLAGSRFPTGESVPQTVVSRDFMRLCLTSVSAVAVATAVAMTSSALASPAAPTPEAILAAHHTAVGKLPPTGGAELDYAYSG